MLFDPLTQSLIRRRNPSGRDQRNQSSVLLEAYGSAALWLYRNSMTYLGSPWFQILGGPLNELLGIESRLRRKQLPGKRLFDTKGYNETSTCVGLAENCSQGTLDTEGPLRHLSHENYPVISGSLLSFSPSHQQHAGNTSPLMPNARG